jgi:hypothetical protein
MTNGAKQQTRNGGISRVLLGTLAAWIVLAVSVLSVFAFSPMPTAYLLRPLLVAVLIAVVTGVVSVVAGRLAVPVAAALAALIAYATPIIGLFIVLGLLLTRLLRFHGRRFPVDVREATLVPLIALLALSVLRVVPWISTPASPTVAAATGGPRVVVILLDGYPRSDTLAQMGFDNEPFVGALEQRGFDHYPDAVSAFSYTHTTLLSMLTDQEVPDREGTPTERREVRAQLFVPAGYLAISPPVGHVVLNGGPQTDPTVLNNFEVFLLGQSIVGRVATQWTGAVVMEGFRQNLSRAFEAIETTAARRVFAHLMSPHPPFLFDAEGRPKPALDCWPSSCALLDSTIEDMGISRDAWAEAMSEQVAALNARLLELTDALLAKDPGTVIVFFSDHGGRRAEDEADEWHHSFLVARTPGFPGLFRDDPGPRNVLRQIERAYGEGTP